MFLSFPQACRPYCQSIWGPGSCRQLSATSAVMRRASLCAGTMTAGASAPWTTHSVIAPRWIWGPWKPVYCKSGIPGIWPTETLRSQVSVFLFCAHSMTVTLPRQQITQRKTKTERPWKQGTVTSDLCNGYSSVQHLGKLYKNDREQHLIPINWN